MAQATEPVNAGERPKAHALAGTVAGMRPRSRPGLGGGAGVVLVLAWLLVAEAGGALLVRLGGFGLDAAGQLAVARVFASAVVLWLGARWSGLTPGELLPLRRFPLSTLPALVLAAVGVTVTGVLIGMLVPTPAFALEPLRALAAGSTRIGVAILMVVAAPLTEEPVFRGLLFCGFRRRYRVVTAALLATSLFVLPHLAPINMVPALAFGLGGAWLVVRTGSLLPGIAAHATGNLVVNFALLPLLPTLATRPLMVWLVVVLAPVAGLLGCAALWWQLRGYTLPPAPARPEPRPQPVGWALAAVLLLAVAALVGSRIPPAALQGAPSPGEVPGCWELSAAAPLTLFGEPGTETARVRFTATPTGARPRARASYVVLPASAPEAGAVNVTAPVTWAPASGGQISVLAQGPGGGMVLRLQVRGGAMAGTARRYNATGQRASGEAAVSGRRIPCPGEPSSAP